jgi:HSP20 family protein
MTAQNQDPTAPGNQSAPQKEQVTPPAKQAKGNGGAASQGNGQTQDAHELPTFIPPADVLEAKDSFMVILDMPGADPQSLDITLEKHVLAVSARSTPWRPEGYTLLAAEYQDGNYSRSFVLSDRVDESRIEAKFRDGVLRINLPKAAPAPAKKIQVMAA